MKALATTSGGGSRAVANMLQAKLEVGEPGDRFEQEADAVAEQVVSSSAPNIQAKCAECEEEESLQMQPMEEEEEEELQMKPQLQLSGNEAVGNEASPWIQNKINSSRGGGSGLDSSTRSFMESRIESDFSNVKIHTSGEAVQMNRELGAKAFTVGSDIYFNEGQYRPESTEGKKLLAHELTHTVQQGAATERVQRQDGEPPARFRLPIAEILGMQYGGILARNRRPLTSSEKSIARPIFGSSINYDQIRIVETSVINAPTTLGNNIRIAPGSSMSNGTLIHELAHIWQYQTKGNAYISDSAFHQVAASITTGSRNAAYTYKVVPGKSIHHYQAEQQASIVEDYYLNRNKEKSNPEFQRMIREVQSSSPTMTDVDRYTESMYGPETMNQRLMDSMPGPMDNMNLPQPPSGNVFRIEF